ncbi:hypothetical protein OROGR_000895 [Orobanche gracilis]
MKISSVFFSLFLILLTLVYSSAHLSNAAAITCGAVDMKAAPCIGFATGRETKPSAGCCSGLQQLAWTVKTVYDKKAVCRCLKAGVRHFSGVQDKYLRQIPAACRIRLGFPVSVNIDCEKAPLRCTKIRRTCVE